MEKSTLPLEFTGSIPLRSTAIVSILSGRNTYCVTTVTKESTMAIVESEYVYDTSLIVERMKMTREEWTRIGEIMGWSGSLPF